MTKEEEIADLESQLTGDMFADMDIKDQIHKLKLEEAGGSCDIDDPCKYKEIGEDTLNLLNPILNLSNNQRKILNKALKVFD